jgi:hypothetical protein
MLTTLSFSAAALLRHAALLCAAQAGVSERVVHFALGVVCDEIWEGFEKIQSCGKRGGTKRKALINGDWTRQEHECITWRGNELKPIMNSYSWWSTYP